MSKLFDELVEGLTAYQQYQEGKITLKTSVVELPEPIMISPEEIKAIRNKPLNRSRSYNRKTYETLANF